MDFADALRSRLVAQANLFAGVSSHTTITGTGRELALADLLRELLPRRLEVLSGVIAQLDGAPGKSTQQVDLIIADTLDFPLLARAGGLAVVLPDAVRAVVEVKTRVSGEGEFRNAMRQISKIQAESNGHVLALQSLLVQLSSQLRRPSSELGSARQGPRRGSDEVGGRYLSQTERRRSAPRRSIPGSAAGSRIFFRGPVLP